jgi:C4-type Zn-finger protein
VEEKLNLSHIKKKKTKSKDPCPICEKDLYFNDKYSQRIGIFDTSSVKHDVMGWACPHCMSEFDIDDNIMYIYGQDSLQGNT